jgi:reactive intermediate/imine deaminase
MSRFSPIHVALVTLAFMTPTLAAQARQVIHGPGEVAGLPFSSAVRVGELVFVSGQIGNVPGTRQLADTGVAGQTRRTLENIKAILEHAGSALGRVARCTVYLTDLRDYPAMNAAYAEYFPHDPPARATVGVRELVFGARVEIECVAAAGAA